MTKIQRYEMNHKGLPEPDDNGVWVFREEHDAVVAALQEQAHSMRDDYNKQLCALLPDARYMDPPDGGSVTPMEQVTRMVIDLQEQVQQLAAEVSTVKVMNDALSEELRGYESDGAYEGPNMHKLWHSNADMPATDAVIREIGAKAVEGFGDVIGVGSLHLALILKKCAYDHAAKLRKGEQP